MHKYGCCQDLICSIKRTIIIIFITVVLISSPTFTWVAYFSQLTLLFTYLDILFDDDILYIYVPTRASLSFILCRYALKNVITRR